MTNYETPCSCGRKLIVSASQAGTELLCTCKRAVIVPKLSVLQVSPHLDQSNDAEPSSLSLTPVFMVAAALTLLFLWVFDLPTKSLGIIIPAILFVGGKLWLLGLMARELGVFALFVFVLPLFDWLFIFKRADIAWKPILLQLLAIVGFVVSSQLMNAGQ